MEADRKKLVVVEMDVLRKLCKVSRIEKIKNKRVKDMMKIKGTILDDLQKKTKIRHNYIKSK